MHNALKVVLGVALIAAGFAAGLWLLGPEAPAPVEPEPEAPPAPWDSALGAPPQFVDVTETAGISFRHENGRTGGCHYLEVMGAGVGVFDYDGDGKLDLYLVNGNRLFADAVPEITNRLLHNLGGWRFEDVTARAGVGDSGYGQGCCVADYDGDGDEDLYVSNFGPNVLYRNAGDGTFEDVAAAAGVADPGWGQSCSFLDYDGDGWLDLYVQNYLTFDESTESDAYIYIGDKKVRDYPSPLGYSGSADRLFRNKGDGSFEDVTERAGLLRPDGKGMGTACVDFDDDGDVDIFVSNDTAANFYFRNRGDGTFEEVGVTIGLAYNEGGVPEASMGVDVGDYDADGRLDMIVPCLPRQVFTLYRNLGTYFIDASVAAGLARVTSRSTGFSPNFIDYDNDGDLDLFFSTGAVRMNELAPADGSYFDRYGLPNILAANDGKGHYTDVSARAGPHFRESHIGRGSAVGDLDGDGDLDLVVCNLSDRLALLRNDTAAGHWLALDLVTVGGHVNMPGTTAWAEVAGARQRRDLHGAVTYLSQNERRVRFGLGAATRADRIEIRWPDGTRQELRDIEGGRVLRIVQGE